MIKSHAEMFVHAVECTLERQQCPVQPCLKYKIYIEHFKTCASPDCHICRNYARFITLHANTCRASAACLRIRRLLAHPPPACASA
jgi:hypothetical protein